MADEFQNVVALTTPVDATPAQRVAKARDALDAKGGPLETARTASLNPLLQNTTRGRAFLQNDFDEAVADFPVDTLAPGLRETLQAIRELYIDHVQGTKPDQTAKHWVAEGGKLYSRVSEDRKALAPNFKKFPKGKKPPKPPLSARRIQEGIEKTRGRLRTGLIALKGERLASYLKSIPRDMRAEVQKLLSTLGFEGHHLIPVELAKLKLLQIATRMKNAWHFHGPSNGIPLPAVVFGDALPPHVAGAGHAEYNRFMTEQVLAQEGILTTLARGEGKSLAQWAQTTKGSQRIRQSIRELEQVALKELRNYAKAGKTL